MIQSIVWELMENKNGYCMCSTLCSSAWERSSCTHCHSEIKENNTNLFELVLFLDCLKVN